ncbi:MAG: biotin/lipoyl-containing protein [Candidatus Limnocylindrales bacterium]
MTDDERETNDGTADPSATPAADAEAAQPPDAGDASAVDAPPDLPSDPGDVALLGLIDRLAGLLDRSELSELEVQVGGTGIVLRKPVAIAPVAIAAAPIAVAPGQGAGTGGAGGTGDATSEPAAPSRPSVKAPLTGIWYGSPSPGSEPYVTVGGEVAAGQVIGLIEAMKLFNEIKSDLSGRVVRIHAEPGKLVKARQPLIEVDPL